MSLFRCVLTTSTILAVSGFGLAGAQAAALSDAQTPSGKQLAHKAASSGKTLKGRAGVSRTSVHGVSAPSQSGAAPQAAQGNVGQVATGNGASPMAAQQPVSTAPAGQTRVSLSPSQGLPEVVTVSALRRPVRADDVGSSVTVVTDEQIATQQRRTLPDILARQPGLNVVRSGGFGGTTSIFMRGGFVAQMA